MWKHASYYNLTMINCRVASYEMYIIMASVYLYGLYVYPVELPSTCDIATVGKYMLQSYMPVGS